MKDIRRKGGLEENDPAYLANYGRIDVLSDVLKMMVIPNKDRPIVLRRLKALVRYRKPMANAIATCINTAMNQIAS